MVSRLYGGSDGTPPPPEDAVSQYLIVKYEDIIEEPRVMAARIVQWAGVPLTTVSTVNLSSFVVLNFSLIFFF